MSKPRVKTGGNGHEYNTNAKKSRGCTQCDASNPEKHEAEAAARRHAGKERNTP